MADRTLLQTCEAEADNFELCGTTENGVLVQIWTAAITFLLQMYLQKCSKHPWNFSNLVKCIWLNLMTLKVTVWLSRPDVCSYSDEKAYLDLLNEPCNFKGANCINGSNTQKDLSHRWHISISRFLDSSGYIERIVVWAQQNNVAYSRFNIAIQSFATELG